MMLATGSAKLAIVIVVEAVVGSVEIVVRASHLMLNKLIKPTKSLFLHFIFYGYWERVLLVKFIWPS